jgi:hypothetical protein
MKANETVNATWYVSIFSSVVGILSRTDQWVILLCHGIVTYLSV